MTNKDWEEAYLDESLEGFDVSDEERKEIKSENFCNKAFLRLRFVTEMTREWTPALNALDFRALMFVFDRTLGWKKEWEAISRKQCVEGIVDRRKGIRYSYGFTSCEKRAGQVLDRLVERGVLKRRKRFHQWAGFEYSINRDFDPSPFVQGRFKESSNPEGGETTVREGAVPQNAGERNHHAPGGETAPLKTMKVKPKSNERNSENKASDVSAKRAGRGNREIVEKGELIASNSIAFRPRSRRKSG